MCPMQLNKRMHKKGLLLVALIAALALLTSCAGTLAEGDVISILNDELTIRQKDTSIVKVAVKNAKQVRVLDSVVIKEEKKKDDMHGKGLREAIVKDRLFEDDLCLSRSCNY